MNFRNVTKGLFYVILVFMAPNIYAMTLEELIDSYNFDYTDGFFAINAFNDYMKDSNANNQNETLVINLTVNSTKTGYFDSYFDLIDESGTLSNRINQSISSGISNINISFDTRLLTKKKYNYSLRIYNSSNEMVFSKYDIETNQYVSFENGTSINRITDEGVNNNYIRVNLTLNVSLNQDANISVYLRFNETIVSSTKQFSLIQGLPTLSIDFDNETIKSTHFNGNFTVDYVLIGTKLIRTSYNTSIYNFEDFAKTSYFRNYTSSGIDTNANNLSEFLEINFTVAAKSVNIYEIQAEIYDQFNNFVKNLSATQSLALGNQTISVRINGSDIYASKVSGPYVLSTTKLIVNNNVIDSQFEPHIILNLTYKDYERHALPDLKISMNASFNQTTNITNITVQLSNNGEAAAFNIFLDLFNNETFSSTNSTTLLEINQSINYTILISNTSNTTLFTAIVDFDNLVDESNETNNIAQNTQETVVSLAIENLTTIYSNATYKIFEFIILNDGDSAVTDIYWKLDTGESLINTTANISSLAVNERAFVYVAYNYSTAGNYNIKVNSTGISQSQIVTASYSSSVINELSIINFTNINVDGTTVIFEAQAKNMLSSNLTNINWSLDDNNGQTLNSNQKFNLDSNETIFIFILHDYGTSGTFNPTATVTNGTYTDTKSASVQINSTSSPYIVKQATNFSGVFVILNSTKTFYQNWNSSGLSGVTKLFGANLTRAGFSNRQLYGDASQVSDIGIICHHTDIDHAVVINTTNGSVISNMTGASNLNTGGPRCKIMFYRNSTNAIYLYEKGYNSGLGLRLYNPLNKSFYGQVEVKYPYGPSVGQKFIAKQRLNSNETAIVFDDDGNPLKVGIVMINFTNFSIEGLKQFYNMSFTPPLSNLTGLANERSRRTAFAWTADGNGGILTISNSTMTSGTNDRNATLIMHYYNYSLNSFNYTNGKLAASIILVNTSAAVDGELCTMSGRNNNVFGIWQMKNGSVFKVMAAVLNINGTAESGYPLPDTSAETGSSTSLEYVGCYDNTVRDTIVFWWLRNAQTSLYYGIYNKTSQNWSTNNLKTSSYSTPSFASSTLRQVKKTECPEPDCFGLVLSDSNGRVYGLADWNGTNISTIHIQNVASAEINTLSMYFLFAPATT